MQRVEGGADAIFGDHLVDIWRPRPGSILFAISFFYESDIVRSFAI